MPTVRDILNEKGSVEVHTIALGDSVMGAIQKMNLHKIGALVVLEGDQVAGMFTERDVLRRVVGQERRPDDMLVSEVMTTGVACCTPSTDLEEVSQIMKVRRVRHVPVCSADGRVEGLISIGDVNAHHASNQAAHLHYLSEYVYGRV